MSDPYDERMLRGAAGDFGRYLVDRAYDPAMHAAVRVLDRTPTPPGDADAGALAARLASLTGDQRAAVTDLVQETLLEALHGLLHGLSHDEDRIQLLFDGQDVATLGDGLHGDLFLWLARFAERPPRSTEPFADG